ncbi:hypothetical protein COV61_01555 [Candidatus Micrarchaeota archaeon CG11_big_fil_rev_8_21_14_0_20_47_5]|nr:MAG: hypothetical protein AUJ17_01335 [Candidatus Micrarchaeota archaeon CG1_02_47_40]PIN83963.1 MAG: hypothetical protein COV61_01555 [Candidatus Micrarchaeota archaeon CG11_big_fil_rev_8_21_14_0_20_47_5]
MVQKKQEEAVPPKVSGLSLECKRLSSTREIFESLSSLSFLELLQEEDAVVAINVESRDIRRNPYLFSICYFRPLKIEIIYTYTAGMSPKKRRLDILRYLLNLLTLTSSRHEIDMRQAYQLLEDAISEMNEYVTSDYDKLYSVYDNMKNEITTMQKKLAELRGANALLSKENYDLKLVRDELQLKVSAAQAMSDDVLAAKIQEWVSEHDSEINITEFSKTFNVPETRVEQMLNRLVSEGYLSARQ